MKVCLLVFESIQSDFCQHHLHVAIVELNSDPSKLVEEQDMLDGQEDKVSDLDLRIQNLCTLLFFKTVNPHKVCETTIQAKLLDIEKFVCYAGENLDRICIVKSSEERLVEQFSSVHTNVMEQDLKPDDSLKNLIVNIERSIFACSWVKKVSSGGQSA